MTREEERRLKALEIALSLSFNLNGDESISARALVEKAIVIEKYLSSN